MTYTSTSEYTKERLEALGKTLSPGRLLMYRQDANNDELKAIRLYLWNTALAEAMYFPLETFEVALRNSIDGILRKELGDEWWQQELFDSERSVVIGSLKRLRLNQASANKHGKSAARKKLPHGTHHDNVIAELSFQFWCGIFAGHHDELWKTHLCRAFPKKPPGVSRKDMQNMIEKVKDLRNDIAHYEPIYDRDLPDEVDEMVKVVYWICPETANWMKENCRVQSVFNKMPR